MPLLRAFGADGVSAYSLIGYMMPFMFSSFLFSGNTIVLNVYFQSTAKPRYSLLISIIRGLAATIPLMYLLSSVFGIAGLWWAVPTAEIISLTAAMLFLKRIKKIPAV